MNIKIYKNIYWADWYAREVAKDPQFFERKTKGPSKKGIFYQKKQEKSFGGKLEMH